MKTTRLTQALLFAILLAVGSVAGVSSPSTEAHRLESGRGTDCNNNGIPDDEDTSVHFATHTWGQPYTERMITSDIDGDGDQDLITSQPGYYGVRWYENTDGQGAFGPAQSLSTLPQTSAVITSDLDGDGDLDIIASSNFVDYHSVVDPTIGWWENTDGEATFGPQQSIADETRAWTPRDLAAADVDGDGDPDVASVSTSDDLVRWFENDVTWLMHTIDSDADGAFAVTFADMDGDEDPDVLVAAYYDDTITHYRNHGSGAFSLTSRVTHNADGATDVSVGDLDGDGDFDVLSTSSENDRVAWYENMDGVGEIWEERLVNLVPGSTSSAEAVDLDNDGDLDVISSSSVGTNWHENQDGQGLFGLRQGIDPDSAPSIAGADLDADGDVDVAATSLNEAAWHENLRDDCNNNGVPDECEGLECIDVDQDGVDTSEDCDDANPLCTTDCTDSDGDGYCVTTDCDDWLASCTFDCTDADGDGFCVTHDCDDLAWGCETGCVDEDLDGFSNCRDCDDSNVFCGLDCTDTDGDGRCWYQDCDQFNPNCTSDCTDGDGDGYCVTHDCDDTIETCTTDCTDPDGDGVPLCALDCGTSIRFEEHVLSQYLEELTELYTGDVGGDGDLDLLVKWGFSTFRLERNDAAAFELERTFSSTWTIAIADLDGDGDGDVLTARSGQGVRWYEDVTGNGSFGSSQLIGSTDSATKVLAGDVDNDGDLDVVLGGTAAIVWFEALDEHANFGLPQTISVPTATLTRMDVADFDGDMDLDVVSMNHDQILWHEQGSEGWVDHPIGPSSYYDWNQLVASDLDGDGDQDVVTHMWLDDIYWFENLDGEGDFGPQQVIGYAGINEFSLATADMDNDGDLDVVAARTWRENLGGAASWQARGTGYAFWTHPGDLDGDGDVDLPSVNQIDPVPKSGPATSFRWRENLRDDCNQNGVHDSCEDPAVGGACVDVDHDGVSSLDDCDEGNPRAWSIPGPAEELRIGRDGSLATFAWQPPAQAGGTSLHYDLLWSEASYDFSTAICVETDETDTEAGHDPAPPAGFVDFFLVRAENECSNASAMGADSDGTLRYGIPCPVEACPGGSIDPDADGVCDSPAIDWIVEGTTMTYRANATDPGFGLTWVNASFDDSAWSSGVFGVGYEYFTGGAEELITTTVPVGTYSVYTRTTFSIPDVSEVETLELSADYDDGYAVWINGLEVYRSPNLPTGLLDWNTDATNHESSNGDDPDYGMPISLGPTALEALQNGQNVVAIGVWNHLAQTSSDLVLVPRLTTRGAEVDNCPFTFNPGQDDSDGDGAGDACDF